MNAEDVLSWREALIQLSDQHFFDIMRMYLGAIKTPFNKQRLIEELSSFLRKKENREKILLCLDEFDCMILSSIGDLPSPTQQKIVSLFNGFMPFPDIYERILNLEERLVIYRKCDANNREYAINPLLVDDLQPLLGVSVLVRPETHGEQVSIPPLLDDLVFAALYSFFLHEGESVKNDGSFRKKTLSTLESVFPQIYAQKDCLQLILVAFQNLGLLLKNEGRLVPDPVRWQSFAKVDPLARIAWVVAAVGGRCSRDVLQRRAQVFLDFYSSLEDGVLYKKEMVSRLAFLLSEKTSLPVSGRTQGRFSTIIRNQESSQVELSPVTPTDLTSIAVSFGMIVEQDGLLVKNSIFSTNTRSMGANPYLVVSPSLTVTLMPGFSLADLLPLVACMEVRDIQIAGQFEITRKSCAAAFDQGFDAPAIVSLFRIKSQQPLPQNVEFSISDWFRNYSAVSLFHGYILRVDESRRVLFENDEFLSSLIRKILAPGIYLLDAETSEEIQAIFSRADIDFHPSVSCPVPKHESVDLPALQLSRSAKVPPASNPDIAKSNLGKAKNIEEFNRLRSGLVSTLDALALSPEFDEALRSRIERRIVLSPSQLDPDSVRIEKIEARGMDFLGKVRIAEYALASGSLLEIVLDEKEGSRQILGRPVSTEKRTGDVLLKIVIEPDLRVEQISLGKAVLVRRIRGSIFSELPQGRS